MSISGEGSAAAMFLPGQVLGSRYRVVERVGKGGMGEVYRAHDLRLGQTVALKFLPADRALDTERRKALFAEVRLARQVTHPNVCRVHDIEEMDGVHCISMEFVDGEDLASLLRRIGHLPVEKAVELAREMCAGLQAIHERGVLHRDLKPANIMIDGRGHARITDFGLAEPEGTLGDPELMVGTPDYMPPEILLGTQDHSVQGDLYGLGLVMYELFTGRRPFEAGTIPELAHARETAPPSPARHRSDVPPAVEQAVLQCLEPDPARRPRSAAAVAAALPKIDWLANAIAAGETPSPELVIAPSEDEGMQSKMAWAALGALAIGLMLLVSVAPRTRVLPQLGLTQSPDAMAARAQELRAASPSERPVVDRARGYEYEPVAPSWSAPPRWDQAVTFWYRESPTEMVAKSPAYRVTAWDPPWTTIGMVRVRLDAAGMPVGVDGPWTAPDEARRPAPPIGRYLRPVLFLAALFLGAWLTRRNLRARRGDRPRALRIALTLFALRVLVWLLGGHITAGAFMEQLTTTIAWALLDATYGWLFYIAIEPYVRRLWPRMLTSWARLLGGRYADPRVGRDVLVGCLTGTAIALAVSAHAWVSARIAGGTALDNVGYVESQLTSLLGFGHQAAEILGTLRSNLVTLMGFLVILVMARLLLRRADLAFVTTLIVFATLGMPRGPVAALDFGFAAAWLLLLLLVLLRFGVLAAGVGLVTHALLQSAPLGMPPDSWATPHAALPPLLVLALGLYGFARSLGARSAFADPLATK